MKRTWFKVLPLALMLAYCSGPNNTQTTQSTDDTSSATASTTTDNTTDATTASDETATTGTTTTNTNTEATGTTASTTSETTDVTGTTANSGTMNDDYTYEYRGRVTVDTTDGRWAHWQRVNGQHWTYDFDKKQTGDLNLAVNGGWQLVMTPELVTAWRNEDRSQVYAGMYPSLDGNNLASRTQLMAGETFISASESFDNTNTNSNLNSNANLNATGTSGATGSVNVNGSTNAGTISSNNNSSSTHALNNNASANSAAGNTMNGSKVSGSVNTGTSTLNNNGTTGTASVNGSASVGTTDSLGSVDGSASLRGTTDSLGSASVDANLNATSGTDASTTSTLGIESVDYTAANGNYYQLPRFNLFIDNGSFTGYTGCNAISGRVEVSGNTLRFQDTNPQTKIECTAGFNEQALLDLLKRVDSYQYSNDELQLLQGGQIVMRFKRNGQASDGPVNQ